jgi:hypothetical protein
MNAMFGADYCDEFASMTACLAAHEMAAQGTDGHTATFMLSPGEHLQQASGYVMPHIVAGSYNKAESREGVQAPVGHGCRATSNYIRGSDPAHQPAARS